MCKVSLFSHEFKAKNTIRKLQDSKRNCIIYIYVYIVIIVFIIIVIIIIIIIIIINLFDILGDLRLSVSIKPLVFCSKTALRWLLPF